MGGPTWLLYYNYYWLNNCQLNTKPWPWYYISKINLVRGHPWVIMSCDHTMCTNYGCKYNVYHGNWTIVIFWYATFLQVWQSVERGQWLGEEPYEMSNHFPSARLYRLERKATGLLYKPRLFSPAGSIFVSSSCTNPPAQQLERLLTLTGGKVSRFTHWKGERREPLNIDLVYQKLIHEYPCRILSLLKKK